MRTEEVYQSNEITENKDEVHAPKNPHKKGNCIYLLQRTPIQGTEHIDFGQPETDAEKRQKNYTDEIYLDTSRMKDKIKLLNGIQEESILSLFDTVQGFRSIVDGIGISFEDTDARQIEAEWIFYGKTDRYASGTHICEICPADGSETLFWMDDIVWSKDDAVPGQIRFRFREEGMCAKVTVALYVKEEYHFPQISLDPAVSFASADYLHMIERSQKSFGNNYRLKKALMKAKNGEPITLAFIGGSITQGAGAKPENTKCYSYLVWKGMKELLQTDKIQYVRAGLGGTPSELGMIRYETDVLRKGAPDIVVIEFAVNDADDETKGQCYESLIRKVLCAPNEPAVLLLFSVFSNDWNLQDRLAPIGSYYGLPMVSVLDAVSPQFGLSPEGGRVISKRQYFYDCYHPTNDGHEVMADCVLKMAAHTLLAPIDPGKEIPRTTFLGRSFERVMRLDRGNLASFADEIVIDPGDFTGTDLQLQMAPYDDETKETPQFPFNWMHMPDTGKRPFCMKLRCQSLFLIAKDAGENDFGQAQIVVDGIERMVIDPHKVGWTHCHPILLIDEASSRPHEIAIAMTPESEAKAFTILGFGVVR